MVVGAGGGPRQNPTTSGIAGIRLHVVRDGDSLQSIAYTLLRRCDPVAHDRRGNGIDDPMALPRGANADDPEGRPHEHRSR